MTAAEARKLYIDGHVPAALEKFYMAIAAQATSSLRGNFYDLAEQYSYEVLAAVAEKLREQGFTVHYSDGNIRSTKIFSISW